MLILTRAVNQGVRIDDDTLITVLGINKRTNEVRLGFTCPRSKRIMREEVWSKNQIENTETEHDEAKD